MNDGGQSYTYDAVGKQSYASGSALSQSYDGDGLRVKKAEYGAATYYLRSSVLGGQVIAEINSGGGWARGYVYMGGQLLAIQDGAVIFVHQDPITKSQRLTDTSGNVVAGVELDPWGGDTNRSWNQSRQPHKFTSYERDQNGSDDAQARRYHGYWNRFAQPDPFDGSYNLADPQSFNRYSYTQNDPVNFVDPTGLYEGCVHEAMTKFLATLTGDYSDDVAAKLGRFAGDGPGGADSPKYAATSFKNAALGFLGKGPSAQIHFASEATLARNIANFPGYIATGNYQRAAFVLHSIQDVHGAHQGKHLPLGHFPRHAPDRIIGDAKFLRAANETFQVLSGDNSVSLSGNQVNDLISAIVTGCGNKAKQLKITRPTPTRGGGGGGGRDPRPYRGGGGFGGWTSLDILYLMYHSGGGYRVYEGPSNPPTQPPTLKFRL